MRATLMYGAGDVRVENVPDARIIKPTDALITVTRSCICGSDLWPYKAMGPSESGRVMGHEPLASSNQSARTSPPSNAATSSSCRSLGSDGTCIEELLPDVLEGRIEPGRVFG